MELHPSNAFVSVSQAVQAHWPSRQQVLQLYRHQRRSRRPIKPQFLAAMGTLECQTTVPSVPRASLDDFIAVRAARVIIAAADFARICVGGGEIGPEWQALGGVIWALQLGAMLQLGIILKT